MELDMIKQKVLEDVDPQLKEQKKRERRKTRMVVTVQFLMLIALILFIFYLLMGISTVKGESMYPTLHDKDVTVYYRLRRQYKAGDVVVIKRPGDEEYVKRIVAVAGDTVNIQAGKLYVNGDEKAFSGAIGDTNRVEDVIQYPVTIKDDEVFVLGDNRMNSEDSREFGAVKTEDIKGKIIWYIGKL